MHDDSTPLGDAVVSMHQLFINMLAAGFTEWQACLILGMMMANQTRGSGG